MTSIIADSWSCVVNGADGLHSDDFFNLACMVSQPNRSYHNLTHITNMAGQLLALDLGSNSTDLHRAIWWHDCIYDSRAKDNEERSAEEMVKTFRSWGVDQAVCDRAHTLVMATKSNIVPEDDEEGKLPIDLDLSILAAPTTNTKVTRPRFAKSTAGSPTKITEREDSTSYIPCSVASEFSSRRTFLSGTKRKLDPTWKWKLRALNRFTRDRINTVIEEQP